MSLYAAVNKAKEHLEYDIIFEAPQRSINCIIHAESEFKRYLSFFSELTVSGVTTAENIRHLYVSLINDKLVSISYTGVLCCAAVGLLYIEFKP